MKPPAFLFYPADWRKDPALQSCSIAARGLWHELMCVMHECTPYGHLAINGKAIDEANAARLVGVSVAEYRRAMDELEGAGVPSRDPAGVLFSRRMINDQRVRKLRAEAGSLGGNPILLNQRDKQEVNPKVGVRLLQGDKQKPTPSVAVAVAVADSKKTTPSSTPTVARATPEKAGFSETSNRNPKPGAHWQVPGLDDHQGLDRFARERGVKPESFPSYPELQAHLIKLVKTENAKRRALRDVLKRTEAK